MRTGDQGGGGRRALATGADKGARDDQRRGDWTGGMKRCEGGESVGAVGGGVGLRERKGRGGIVSYYHCI